MEGVVRGSGVGWDGGRLKVAGLWCGAVHCSRHVMRLYTSQLVPATVSCCGNAVRQKMLRWPSFLFPGASVHRRSDENVVYNGSPRHCSQNGNPPGAPRLPC